MIKHNSLLVKSIRRPRMSYHLYSSEYKLCKVRNIISHLLLNWWILNSHLCVCMYVCVCVCVCVCYKLKMAGYSFKMVPKHPNGQQLSSVIIVIKHHTKTFSDRKFNYKCYKKHWISTQSYQCKLSTFYTLILLLMSFLLYIITYTNTLIIR